MTFIKSGSVVLILALLSGCGGSRSNAGTSTTLNFVTPKVNSQRVYANTILDNSNNTINQTIRDTITTVNADGSFVFVHVDPNRNSVTVNGTAYSTPTETITDNSSGQELSHSFTAASQLNGNAAVLQRLVQQFKL